MPGHTAPSIPLVCPVCRVPREDGSLPVEPLAEGGGGDSCAACGSLWPRTDGIPCISPDRAAFVASQGLGLDASWPPDAGDEAAERRACEAAAAQEPGSDGYREACLPGQYAAAHFPAAIQEPALAQTLGVERNWRLVERVRAWARHAPAGPRLEVGCGPGGLLEALAPTDGAGAAPVVGFDVRLSMLRIAARVLRGEPTAVPLRVEGRRFTPLRLARPASSAPFTLVQGDLYAPPFHAESFALVAALSVLDTVPDPLFALGQLDALTRPGGLLLLGAPWSWEPGVTAPADWWSTPDQTADGVLREVLAGRHPALPHLGYDLLETATEDWALPGHGRVTFVYRVEMVLARKR